MIGEDVKIGPRAVLQGGNQVGAKSVIGADSNLFPNVTLYSQTQIGQRVRIHSGPGQGQFKTFPVRAVKKDAKGQWVIDDSRASGPKSP